MFNKNCKKRLTDQGEKKLPFSCPGGVEAEVNYKKAEDIANCNDGVNKICNISSQIIFQDQRVLWVIALPSGHGKELRSLQLFGNT